MALRRLLAAALVSAALVVPAAAGAAQPSPIDVAADVGARYWGAVPCGGQVKVLARRPPAPGRDPADAWVTFDTPLGANNLAAPAGSYTNCTIAFARRRWPTAASMRADWGIFCATMTHELGHLLGHQHDTTPGSVMAPVFTDHSSVPARCRAARPARAARKSHRKR
ncbi:MAG TPA: matrixin family metalloprotease [Solirubrobacteraceae bacterium]|nr:matrixin family metalloprotease [Solirubrobacteraceae bacterium]